jgi:hypothetical protein
VVVGFGYRAGEQIMENLIVAVGLLNAALLLFLVVIVLGPTVEAIIRDPE